MNAGGMTARYTVSDVNRYIKNLISGDSVLSGVTVVGEISNFKAHFSGHLYFSLKDENSAIRCVMFRSRAETLRFRPADGQRVSVTGSVSVYEKEGSYQLYVSSMSEDGVGELAQRFERLKKQLEAEGIFDPAHKVPIPAFPRTVAVLTSSTGAVIRDIINVATRRFPGVRIRLLPVPVQGSAAAQAIASALREANRYRLGDVIIVGRGGGSLEDLWPFNEEVVARAVYESEIPVISAVGHETDFTICDFAADLRAPTPSAAAELAVPDARAEADYISDAGRSMQRALRSRLDYERVQIERLRDNRFLTDPLEYINMQRMDLDSIRAALDGMAQGLLSGQRLEVHRLQASLEAMDPYGVLERGYTAVSVADGRPVISVSGLARGDTVNVRFRDGNAKCRVLEVTL